MKQTLKAGYLL